MTKIDVTLVRSTIGKPRNQVMTVRSLGLKKLNQTVRHDDNPRIRGMVNKIPHLVKAQLVEEK